jgi:tRNA(Ile)-lysidine synthase
MVKSKIKNFLDSLNYSNETKFLLAVSGGIDSMVLLEVMSTDYKIHVAHINHGMRGEESDQDELLVKKVCVKKGIPFHSTLLPNELKSQGNFQSTARNFRYTFFNKILDENSLDVIVTAHHKDDSIETTLFNLLRGTGLEGLQGIPENNTSLNVIRPMIEISKSEIHNYAQALKIKFREDSSNEKDTYSRNHIRHHLIPFIEKEYGLKGLHNTIRYTQDYFKQYSFLLDQHLSPIKQNDSLKIDLKKLKIIHNPPLALFHYSKDYGFNIDQCGNLLENESGKRIRIESQEYEMIKDRSAILIRKIIKQDCHSAEILDVGLLKIGGFTLKVEFVDEDKPVVEVKKGLILSFPDSPFPMTIRSRKEGDSFKPNGMSGQGKTVKKFIIDSKLSTEEMDQLFILEKNSKILAVFPYRVSNGFSYDKARSFHIAITIQKA